MCVFQAGFSSACALLADATHTVPSHAAALWRQEIRCIAATSSVVQVAEDHCWISLDGQGIRESAAEVATEKGQGEPPTEGDWTGWLYSAGHATVCTDRQVVAAILTSMDTCVGEKATQDLDDARELQCKLLQCLGAIDQAAMYTNAACVLAELQQDAVLDAAKQAGKLGGDVRQELKRLQPLYHAMLRAARLSVSTGVLAPTLCVHSYLLCNSWKCADGYLQQIAM